MEESDDEKAATALQRRFENAVSKNQALYKSACFGKSCWIANLTCERVELKLAMWLAFAQPADWNYLALKGERTQKATRGCQVHVAFPSRLAEISHPDRPYTFDTSIMNLNSVLYVFWKLT